MIGAVDPDGGSNKPLHQKAFRWADIRLVERHARLAEQLFIAHQLTMGATVEAVHRLAAEVFLDRYFANLEGLVSCGLFDAVGHADTLLRGLPEDVFLRRFEPLLA